MHEARFAVGIDLGTSNSAVAYVDTEASGALARRPQDLPIPQLVAAGHVEPRPLLASSLYLPGGHEIDPGGTRLPWDPSCRIVVGSLARSLGARIPGRLVHSAKSWLCHPTVDRRAPLLPWAAPDDVPRLSPVEASARFLEHIREAWAHRMEPLGARGLSEQDVYLAVPASFDAVARQLTVEAARAAGMTHVTLVEEPQVAFYCMIATSPEGWWEAMGEGRLVLVCDVGGGTTDFTLVVVRATGGGQRGRDPSPTRIAVGDHLLLGGDNMDLALAHRLEPRLAGRARLSPWEWGELVHACRDAKEALWSEGGPASVPVTVLGSTSRVVEGTRRTPLGRAEQDEVLLDGFLPACALDAVPSGQGSGLVEQGLPYAADPAITRHLAAFLCASEAAIRQALRPSGRRRDHPIRPDAVLFNGGAFRPAVMRERLLSVIRDWFGRDGRWSLEGVVNSEPDLAVARGAAYYGLVCRGMGIRIAGGAARSYYVGLGDGARLEKLLCVVGRGTAEGPRLEVPGRRFSLLLGQPVRFPLYASSTRVRDRLGDVIEPDARGLVALPPLRTFLDPPAAGATTTQVVLHARLTETGQLALDCQPVEGGSTYTLELDLRGAAAAPARVVEAPARGQRDEACLERAKDLVRAAFAPPGPSNPHVDADPRTLRRRMEEVLEAGRELWIPSTLRALLGPILETAQRRLHTPRHEAWWIHLAGYCIRPGFGHPGDDVRVEQLWSALWAGVRFKREPMNHREWWIMARRLSGGLDPRRQVLLFESAARLLLPGQPQSRQIPPEATRPGVIQEMWRLAASLERLDIDRKVALGDELLTHIVPSGATAPHVLWALARLGARWPIGGDVSTVVGPLVAQRWIDALLGVLQTHGEAVSFTLAHVARRTDDRHRDVDERIRVDLIRHLERTRMPSRHIQLVRERVTLEATERSRLIGDALPPGLMLVDDGD